MTLNVCLGRDFEGGELRLLGSRGGGKEMSEEATISPRTGYAVLHAGRKLHEVITPTFKLHELVTPSFRLHEVVTPPFLASSCILP